MVSHISFKEIPKQAKVCSPEVKGWDPAACLAPSSQNPEFNHPLVTAGKAAPDLHISHVCRCEDQQECLPLSAPPPSGPGICHQCIPEAS